MMSVPHPLLHDDSSCFSSSNSNNNEAANNYQQVYLPHKKESITRKITSFQFLDKPSSEEILQARSPAPSSKGNKIPYGQSIINLFQLF